MSRIQSLVLFILLGASISLHSQPALKWWNPANESISHIEGQAWPKEVKSPYDRLPARAKADVRKPVWSLSRNSAGLAIRFRTNAKTIKVRYKVSGGFNMPHMPSTGVTGLDLYARDSEGNIHWLRGLWSFGDTCSYTFRNIEIDNPTHDKGNTFQLWLPLYNTVEWLEIGTPDGDYFEPLPVRQEKPLVVYGTSIAQGACASRPGMAWTSILGRSMDRPLINLGFSGNGRLEPELTNLLTEIDAKAYIIDCLPNLSPNKDRTTDDVYQLITETVSGLRAKRSQTPILLVAHSGYSDGSSDKGRNYIYTTLNKTLDSAFQEIQGKYEGVYLLSRSEINLGLEDYVDGTHPTDLGMIKHAKAVETKLRDVLNEPKGDISTTNPVVQRREPDLYEWEDRHQQILNRNQANDPATVFFGNSIIHYWSGYPEAPIKRGEKSWKKWLTPENVQNHAFGWDRIENILWRIYHDELDWIQPDNIVLMLGTNNLHLNADEDILTGISQVVDAISHRQPEAKIVLLGIFPRRDGEDRISSLNQRLEKLAADQNLTFSDPGKVLLKENTIDESLFLDGLHPNEKGYRLLAPKIAELIK